MRKHTLILILFFVIESCYAHDNQSLSVSLVKIYPDTTVYVDKCLNTYSIEIDLKNEGTKPIYFWSWTCSWFLNFIFSRKDIGFVGGCKSNVPKTMILLPQINIKFKGIIFSENVIDHNSIKNLSIGFKFYDGLKFTKEAYLNFFFDKPRDKKKETNTIKDCGDIIWSKKGIKCSDKKYKMW